MSAYSFGKLVSSENLVDLQERVQRLASGAGIEIKFGYLDPSDSNLFDETLILQGRGIVFNLFTPGDSDIVRLWNDAQDLSHDVLADALKTTELPWNWEQISAADLTPEVYERLEATSLGTFIVGLFRLGGYAAGGLTLCDNGVEQVIKGSPVDCQRLMLRSLLVSWDCGPNALFAWQFSV
jgi:hypothetical protein